MTISEGSHLPDASLLQMGPDGAAAVSLAARLQGRRVIIFGLPGAYTSTCTTAHVPSFIRTATRFAEKGVDEIICISVNDPFVMQAWGTSTGATAAGITMLADADAGLSKAIGMAFSAPANGFFDRSKRYALFAVDGVVQVFHPEIERGCEVSGGEAMLAAI